VSAPVPKVVITGGLGQLGRALSWRLGGDGAWEVAALGRGALDVADRDAVRARIAAERPAVVIHAAAMTDVDGCERDPVAAFRVNALGALHVAQAAEEVRARLVVVSTDFVFDGEKPSPYYETDAPSPLSVYAESKLAGERYALGAAHRALVVRTAWLYGPGGRNFVDAILAAGASGKPLRVVADQAGSPTRAADLADGIARVLDAGLVGVVHLVNTGHATRYELARRALDLAGHASTPVEPITTAEMPRPARRPRHAVLGSRVLAAAGVAPLRHWEEALAAHIAERASEGANPRAGERKSPEKERPEKQRPEKQRPMRRTAR
jgi:dTDP-4-dehydrorhamnose reductase